MSRDRPERLLDGSPSLTAAFARAAVGLVPGAARLPVVGTGGRSRSRELPDTVLRLDGVAVDRGRLAAYCRVCGFTLSDTVPATYPHMLAFPLHLALMTDPAFPFAAIGLVHIANRITVARPVTVGERLDIRVWAEDLRPHPRGRQFDIVTEVRTEGELVWDAVSTNLRRGGGGSDAPAGAATEAAPPADAAPSELAERSASTAGDFAAEVDRLPGTAVWSLPGDLGRRYAGVSGDANPIHVSGPTARLFGFPRAIAHGMWTKARSLAQLEGRLPDAYTVAVEFKRPILLPGRVEFCEAGDAFAVRGARDGTPHLAGTVSGEVVGNSYS